MYSEGNSRSRYDYYYSMSSPSLSRAASFFESQHGSLFGDPVLPLIPQPTQSPNSYQKIQLPTLMNAHPLQSASSSTSTFAGGSGGSFHHGSTPLIDNFDQHLYESIRRNIMDHQNNNINVQATANALSNKLLWTQQSSTSQTPTPPLDREDFEKKKKRSGSAMSIHDTNNNNRQSKYRSLLARSGSLRLVFFFLTY